MRQAPHPFTLRQLQYAVAVSETLSFRGAAERCRVSQPSLSAQLAELESGLGVRLFERNRRKVVATPAGESLVRRARELLMGADDLLRAAQVAVDPLAGTLRVGILPTISPYFLPLVTPRLRKAFSKLSVVWIEDKTRTLVRELNGGNLEAAVLALEADLGEVERDILGRDDFVLAAPPGHPLARKTSPIPLRDLRGADILLLDEGHCLREQALELCAASKAREMEFRATSLPTLAQMVAAGAGFTLLPALAMPTETQRAALAIRRFAPPVPHRTLALVWRPGSALADALRKLAAVLRVKELR
jgi:LysR family hydrogen peroxide-inducible transcriptional activator